MNRAVVDSPSFRTEQQALEAAASLVWWHVGWLAVLVLGTAVILVLPISLTAPAVAGLVVGACPALAGIFLARSRHGGAPALILVNWAVSGVLAAGLTGGLGGPLAVWLLAPLAAGAAMAKPERLALAAAISVGAVGISGMASLTLNLAGPPAYDVATALGAMGLATTAMGLGVALVVLQRNVDLDRRRRALVEARLREALGEQPNLLISIFPTGKLSAAWGNAPKELKGQIFVGRPVAQLAATGDRPRIEAALEAVMTDGHAEVAFAPAGGTEPWLELTLRRVNSTRILGAIRDARVQRSREAALEQARAEADAQNAGKSRFLANMSHELRTPLNAIMGFSDIMRQRLFGPMPERYGEYSELIHESGVHLLELINDVLDMSKIEAERFELHREEFDVRDAANAVLRLMRGQADRAGVQLRGVLPKEPLEVDADRRAIKQIALNLISNALKFTPKGGAVTLTVHASGPVLEMLVADTGPGIRPEDIPRLGRPYEQAGGQDQRAAGTGLGLSLVRSFAELHGGEMVIESQLGEGATVIVRMPVVVAETVGA
ncbi:HAMP domain-containing sensor histidine kinase [Phenylobacterium aquaticum]|uniref:sensor histidine kinase n=1 Tax=Phenylobacterium aquaticum TaxID=1763816 RepID=UPI0026EFBB8B|nr:HAMP domain-containing sensor histidine kinase [Phenylobacterium aquaticum]